MPYKSEKIKLKPEQDRRRKLTMEQRESILNEYEKGASQRGLGRKYGVDHGTIALIVNPEALEKARKREKEHWMDYIPTKEERNKAMREHRHYKQRLYLEGKLK